jgi:hypothetical protein
MFPLLGRSPINLFEINPSDQSTSLINRYAINCIRRIDCNAIDFEEIDLEEIDHVVIDPKDYFTRLNSSTCFAFFSFNI